MALHDDGPNYINHVDGGYSNGGATNNNVIYAAVLRHSLLTWMGQSRKSPNHTDLGATKNHLFRCMFTWIKIWHHNDGFNPRHKFVQALYSGTHPTIGQYRWMLWPTTVDCYSGIVHKTLCFTFAIRALYKLYVRVAHASASLLKAFASISLSVLCLAVSDTPVSMALPRRFFIARRFWLSAFVATPLSYAE